MIAYSLKEAWSSDLDSKKKYSHDFLFESDEEYTQLKNYILHKEPIHRLVWDKISDMISTIDIKHALLILAISVIVALYSRK